MADSSLAMERFLSRWHELAEADRATILDELPDARRRQLQNMITEAETARAAEAALDRQYSIYSPWLGQLIEAAGNSGEGSGAVLGAIKPPAREALAKAHIAIMPLPADIAGRTLGTRIRQLFADWLGPL